MRHKAILLLLALAALLLAGCGSSTVKGEAPFVQVSNWSIDGTDLTMALRVRNVNDEALTMSGLNFKVLLSGKEISWNYLGHEIDDGAIRCYLEAEGIKELTDLKITHSSLLETFDDQQNMVHVYKGDLTRSLLLTNGEESGTLRMVN